MALSERRHDPALWYFASFVVLGLSATLLGPAIPTLREQTGSSTSQISILFVLSSLGYLIGSVMAGRLYDLRGGHRLLALGLCVTAAGAALAALGGDLLLLGVAFATMGVSTGVVDVGGNTLLVWSRTGPVGSAMNALHLCFGIGALLGPLNVGLSELWVGDIGLAGAAIAGLSLVVAVGVTRRPSPAPRPAGQNMAPDASGEAGSHRVVMLLIAGFFLLYVGLELGFAGWISTYAEEVGLGDSPVPALAAAVFWAGFTLGRVASIPLARRHPPARILAVSCTLAVVASGAMVLADGSAGAVWVCTALFGVAVAPQYPTMVALAEERVGLSGSATSMLVGGSAIGGLALPWLIGQLLDSRGAQAMPEVVFVASVVLLAWFVLVARVTHRPPAPRPPDASVMAAPR